MYPPCPAMTHALQLAGRGGQIGEVPVGAVIVHPDGAVIASAHNEVEQRKDTSAHAEMLAMQRASRLLGSKWLIDCTIVVTLEPCAMCAQAIAHARLKKLIFGAYDSKSGGVEHGARVFQHPTCHWQPEVIGGIQAEASTALLQAFFQQHRHAQP